MEHIISFSVHVTVWSSKNFYSLWPLQLFSNTFQRKNYFFMLARQNITFWLIRLAILCSYEYCWQFLFFVGGIHSNGIIIWSNVKIGYCRFFFILCKNFHLFFRTIFFFFFNTVILTMSYPIIRSNITSVS